MKIPSEEEIEKCILSNTESVDPAALSIPKAGRFLQGYSKPLAKEIYKLIRGSHDN